MKEKIIKLIDLKSIITYIVENNLSPNFEVRVINGVQWQNNIYNYQNGNLITNLTSLSLENFGNVMTVNDNQAYRHIYIEDPNIRPLQVGDKIVAGTKFYFNFPDDFWKNYKLAQENIFDTDYPTPGGVSIFSIGNSTQGVEIMVTDAEGNPQQTTIYLNGTESFIQYSGGMKNLSSYIFNTSGKIISISKDNVLYPYILVDITTLG